MTSNARGSMRNMVREIHKRAIVIDGLGGYGYEYLSILNSGINITNVSLNMFNSERFDYVLKEIRWYFGLIETNVSHIMLIERPEDILLAKKQNKLGLIFGLQNGTALEDDVMLLPILYKLGIRIIQLTYNESNSLGNGCQVTNDTGLTSLGREAVKIMNRLGILIDLSHVGYKTSQQATDLSESPVAITHGNPLALKNVPRNRPDDLMIHVAKKGGVIGLTPYSSFCKSQPGKRPTIDDFLDQIDYVINLVGIDHVGISTDKFEGTTSWGYALHRYPKLIDTPYEHRHVEGFSHITDFPKFTDGLLKRGYSDGDTMKILGGNFYSLYKQVWKCPGF